MEMRGLNNKDEMETEVDLLTESAGQNAESAEVTMKNVEELNQIVDERNSAVGVVVNVSNELIGYIDRVGEDVIRKKMTVL